ncbi:MAG: biopolymer transporter ExbD [Pirellulales bacterium]
MPLKLSNEEDLPSLNMTSMIDVLFVLILFFMVGTTFNQQERQIDIKLPGANTLKSMVPPPQRREVQVAADGSIFLDGNKLSMLELTQRLSDMRRMYPDISVAVRADGNALHGTVYPVYGAVNRAGITNMAVIGRENEKLR